MRNVLSLFDGMSCLQIALRELGIVPDVYYASEIDKHAIKQTQLNFQNTVQLGSVTEWRTWSIDWAQVDLIGAGSPCQGFSFAGKQLAFDDDRSKLFFVFVEILNHCKLCNPDVKFLLENVNMKREYMRIISEYVGIFPVNINSRLVSAQNRDRWYWSNIRVKAEGLFDDLYTDIPQPEDLGIVLKDILEDEVDDKYYLSNGMLSWLNKHSDKNEDKGYGFGLKLKDENDKMSCLTSGQYKQNLSADYIKIGGNHSDMDLICVAMRGRGDNNEQQLEPNHTGKTNALTSVQKDNLVIHNIMPRSSTNGNGGTGHLSKQDCKTYCLDTGQTNAVEFLNINQQAKFNPNINSEKANCITLAMGRAGSSYEYMDAVSKVANITGKIRRLTPLECARLQTVPEWYMWECSDTQQYRMLGNGWTINVITHILKYL